MGGLSGHLLHPYEDIDLSKEEFKKITELSILGKLHFSEKIDGYNIHFLILPNFEIRIARSGKDLLEGGVAKNQIYQRFGKNIPFSNAIYKSFRYIEKYIHQSINSLQFFTPDNPVTYNTEIINRGVTNVIPYNNFDVIIHGTCLWEMEENSSKYQMKTMNPIIKESNTIHLNLPEVTKKITLSNIINQIDWFFENSESINELYFRRFCCYLINNGYDLPKNIEDIFKYFFDKNTKITLNELKKQNNSEDFEILYNKLLHTSNKDTQFLRELKKYTIQPLKELTRYIGNVILLNTTGYLNEKVNEDWFNIKYPIPLKDNTYYPHKLEGVVFQYNMQIYKWTGDFMYINKMK